MPAPATALRTPWAMAAKRSSGSTPTQPTRAWRGLGKKPDPCSAPSKRLIDFSSFSIRGAKRLMRASSCSPKKAKVRCCVSGRTHDAGGTLVLIGVMRSLRPRRTSSGNAVAMKRRIVAGTDRGDCTPLARDREPSIALAGQELRREDSRDLIVGEDLLF